MAIEGPKNKTKDFVYIALIVLTLGAAGFWIFQSYNLSDVNSSGDLGISKAFNIKAGLDLITGKKIEEEKKEEPIDLSIFEDQKFKRMQSSAVKLKDFRLGKQNPFDSSSAAGSAASKDQEVDSKNYLDIKEEDFFSF